MDEIRERLEQMKSGGTQNADDVKSRLERMKSAGSEGSTAAPKQQQTQQKNTQSKSKETTGTRQLVSVGQGAGRSGREADLRQKASTAAQSLGRAYLPNAATAAVQNYESASDEYNDYMDAKYPNRGVNALRGVADSFVTGLKEQALGGLYGAAAQVDDLLVNSALAITDPVRRAYSAVTGEQFEPLYDTYESGFRKDAADFLQEAATRSQRATEGMTSTGKLLANTAQAAGNQLASALFGAAVGGAAGVSGLSQITNAFKNANLLAISAGASGSNYIDALSQGANISDAQAYGLLSGATEYFTERLFGGNTLVDVDSGLVNRVVSKLGGSERLMNFLASQPVEIVNEGLEEMISEIVSPVWQRLTYDPNADWATIDEIIESGISGVLLAGAMQGGARLGNLALGRSSAMTTLEQAAQEMAQQDAQQSQDAYVQQVDAEMRRQGMTPPHPAQNVTAQQQDTSVMTDAQRDSAYSQLAQQTNSEQYAQKWQEYSAQLENVQNGDVLYDSGGNEIGVVSDKTDGGFVVSGDGFVEIIPRGTFTRDNTLNVLENGGRFERSAQNMQTTRAATMAENPQLVRDDAFKRAKLNSKTARALDGVAKALGVEIRFADKVAGGAVNGSYENGVITVALDSDDPLRTVITHETVHRLREVNAEAYNAMERFVRENMSDWRRLSYQNELVARGYEQNTDLLNEETVADAFGYMLENSDVLLKFAQDNRSFAEKLRDALHDVLLAIERHFSKAKNLSESQKEIFSELRGKVAEMERLLGEGIQNASDNGNRGEIADGVKNSLKNSDDNISYGSGGYYVNTKSYRGYGENNPMSRAGYAMFTDDPGEAYYNSYGGKQMYAVDHNRLTDVSDIIPQVENALLNAIENDSLPYELEYLASLNEDPAKTASEIASEMNPTDIVDSAGFWDNEDLVAWLFNSTNILDDIAGVKTSDGAIVFDENAIYKIDGDAEVIGLEEQNGEATNPENENQNSTRLSRKLTNEDRRALDELVKEFGAIEAGEKPARVIQVPRRTSADKTRKVSQTIRTVLEAGATPDEAVPTIENLIADGEFNYEVYGDNKAVERANTVINDKGYENALADWTADVRQGKVNKTNTALGWSLYNAAANAGDTKAAIGILSNIVEHQRSAAQAVQATRILKAMTPEAQLYTVQRAVSNLQQELIEKYGDRAPDLVIDEVLARNYLEAETDAARDEAMKELYRDIGKQMPSRFIDKWNAWRYLAMLGNPRTHIRNIVGNLGFTPIVAAKNVVATGLEATVSRLSGGKTQRSKAFVGLGKSDRALLSAAYSDYANVQNEISNGGKYSDFANANQYIEEGRQIFKNELLERTRKGSSAAFEAEDVIFASRHYAYALAQYCKANGITAEQIRNGGKKLDKARAYAVLEAQKATYRDTNSFSQMISELGRYSGKNPAKRAMSTAIEGILPFRKTPANILVRGVEYSPIGLLKSLTYNLYQVQKGDKTSAEAIDSISAGLTGTGLMMLGAYMAAEGFVRGAGGDDEAKKDYAELTGHQPYALELPNGTSVTLDWLAPQSLPFFVGVNLWEQMQAENEGITMSGVLLAMSNVSDPLLELSCLQSLNDVFDSVSYATSNDLAALPSILASSATSYLTQAIPTLSGQIERTSQSERMTTYTSKNAFLTSDMQYALGRASSRIPVWDYAQIPYIDAWGRTEDEGTVFSRAANNFLNPAYMSEISTSGMEDELLRLYESTSDASVLPDRAPRYFNVDGERKDLTADKYVQYATERGQQSYKMLEQLTATDAYQSADDTDKAALVDMVYEYANALAKSNVSDYKPDGWVAKAIETSKKTGVSEVKYITMYNDIKGIESLKDSDGDAIANSKGLQVMKYIYDTPGLTSRQREALFDVFDVGKTVKGYNKALVNEKLEEMQ